MLALSASSSPCLSRLLPHVVASTLGEASIGCLGGPSYQIGLCCRTCRIALRSLPAVGCAEYATERSFGWECPAFLIQCTAVGDALLEHFIQVCEIFLPRRVHRRGGTAGVEDAIRWTCKSITPLTFRIRNHGKATAMISKRWIVGRASNGDYRQVMLRR